MMEIKPTGSLQATVKVPGSKSYTQRALVIAAMAEGESFLQNVLISEDTRYLMEALRSLGTEILMSDEELIVTGTGGHIENPHQDIFLGDNGTAMRFLTSLVALGKGEYIITGDSRLCERPVGPLLEALKGLGVSVNSRGGKGYPPVVIEANGIRGGNVALTDLESSQYVSSLLISAPYAGGDVSIQLQGRTVSLPYVDLTVEVMGYFGVKVERRGTDYYVKCGQRYVGRGYQVEGDVSSASYFFLAAALCGGRVRVLNINPHSQQGDIRFLRIMEDLGCSVLRGDAFVEVLGGKLGGGEYVADMGDMPDMVPTMAVLSAFRPGRTVIKNVAHLRIKESNRITAPANELKKMGIVAGETDDGLIIDGGKPHGAEIETYNDHRIAMSFAVAGLVVPGVIIKNTTCVNKSFPGFWEELKKLSDS
ncbi:MAG: 3-phosphoshikimate 1-carboxyvinyltransferase [Syntrophales bacterium]|nr:3-phosphoshikimate 1-carboxyvinyltransferase [Syntrophales bacterium]